MLEADSESETSDTNPAEKLPFNVSPNAFNSLKPSLLVGSMAPAGHQKKLQRNNKRRVMPVPVAPPRLPSSANNSTVVTPTTSGAGHLFMATSSFDDSQQDRLTSEASDATTAATTNLDDSIGDAKSALDLEQSQLGETRRNRRQPISKLFSLQSENDSGFFHDISSMVSGGVAALEDAFGKRPTLHIYRSIDYVE